MTPRAQSLTGRCILVAEDEYLIARDVARTLTSAGCAEVHIVPTVAEAEHVRAASRLDAALLDIQLRDGEAGDLAERLIAGGVAVVFMTGYGDRPVPASLTHLPVLPKPVPRQRLLATLGDALAAENRPKPPKA